ncbi:MAG TPA: phage holin family protein, partial [Anaerolineales bacterium]|nr:phage holin family protein [Anaerolineales bacterium]
MGETTVTTLFNLIRGIVRLLVVWFVDTLSLLITSGLVAGIEIQATANASRLAVATAAALLLGIINLLIRPLFLLIALPLGWVVLFLVGLFLNALVLLLCGSLLPGMHVDNLGSAFLGSIILSLVNAVLVTLLAIDDDDSFYENLVRRQAQRDALPYQPQDGRGVVMMETDGLSYYRIKKGIEDGYLPTLKQMMDEEGYVLSRVDSGLPSSTPACQAGILHGNNTNIPAFRWLDKKRGKMMAGGQAAMEIEPELSDGHGLLRGGTSIGNMFSGDAATSLLTFSKMKAGSEQDQRQRARDIFLLMRNPYFFVRVLVLVFGEVVLELWQGWQQRRKNVLPRVSRLHNAYPLVRAGVGVFLRDVNTYLASLWILRRVPAMYILYAGFDEVAHHSGPYTHDSDLELRRFDQQVARLRKVAREHSSRPYEFIALSDHGQSAGATFKQRYGMSILEFVQRQMPEGASVSGSGGGDDGTIGVSAMMRELENIEQAGEGGRVSKAAVRRAHKAIDNNLAKEEAFQEVQPANITVAFGGNAALVYFDLFPRKITLNELNRAYPGAVDRIVQHEGIGFVVAYEDDFTPVAFGKGGARNLHTGVVVGQDPLAPFGDVELRAWQLRRLADFETAGDLILNSSLYPDGSVAAMEELVGSHGGMGGEQTDAYLFHPGDMVVPPTRNSYEVKAILDSRRGLPAPPPVERTSTEEKPSLGVWARGVGRLGYWLGLAAGALGLKRESYEKVADDPAMTGPALVILVLSQVVLSYLASGRLSGFDLVERGLAWVAAVVLLVLASRLVGGKAGFPAIFR